MTDMTTRYRICDAGPENCIQMDSDDLHEMLMQFADRETKMHDLPMKPNEVLQIMRRNDFTQSYDVLFTIIRGNAA